MIAPLVRSSRCALARCNGSVEKGLLMWDRVGLAEGRNHQKEFPSPALHQLRIKSLQHLFSFSDLRSLNKGGDLCGKVMRSLSPYAVPWVSLHHMIWGFFFAFRILSEALLYPSAAYRDLRETSERQPHDTTRRANRRGTRVRNWYIWKEIKDLSRRRQHINRKRKMGAHVHVERKECCPEDHKKRNRLSRLPLSFLLTHRAVARLDSSWLCFRLLPCVLWIIAHM